MKKEQHRDSSRLLQSAEYENKADGREKQPAMLPRDLTPQGALNRGKENDFRESQFLSSSSLKCQLTALTEQLKIDSVTSCLSSHHPPMCGDEPSPRGLVRWEA